MNSRELLVSDIQNYFGNSTFLKGESYFTQNRVVDLSVIVKTGNLVILNAIVNGSGGRRYKQTIAITTGLHLNINSQCSCPVAFNCKHIVAVCLAHREGESQQKIGASTAYMDWLSSLDEASKKLDASREFFAYVLHTPDSNKNYPLSILTTREKKQGGLTVGRNISLSNLRNGYHSNQHFSSEDEELLRLVSGLIDSYDDRVLISGALGHLILSKALQCGRLFWNSHQFGPPLNIGEPRRLAFSWDKQDDAYHLNVTLPNNALLLPTEPPLYLDKKKISIRCS